MKEDDLLLFLDLLDLDEELVNYRLQTIMSRKSFTIQHLTNASHLLNYKYLVNIKESDECENDLEFEFIGKLIENLDEKHIDTICNIVSVILCLNPSSILVKSEHLLQELLNIPFTKEYIDCEENHSKLLSHLKLCDSVVEAVIKVGEKLSLPFLSVPLQNIIFSANEGLKRHFLTKTVKKFFDGVTAYNILDRIWHSITQDADKLDSLKVLSVLSNYYLPLPDKEGIVLFQSSVISQREFWEICYFGLISNDPVIRKLAIYLLKRTIDCLMISNLDIDISTPIVTMKWVPSVRGDMKKSWDNYFILIDSLEEKQSNIVLPSLHLFTVVQLLGKCWLNCAYNIGLQHDNLEVKTTCIKHRLSLEISNDIEANILLDSLNDMNIFDNQTDCDIVKEKFTKNIIDEQSFMMVIRNITKTKWSPVPLYHLSDILAKRNHGRLPEVIFEYLYELIKVPCNNVVIRRAFYQNLFYIIGNSCESLSWKRILNLFNLITTNYLVDKKILDELSDIELGKKGDSYRHLFDVIKNLSVHDKRSVLEELTKSHLNIDFTIVYLMGHEDEVSSFIALLESMFNNIKSTDATMAFDVIQDAIFLSSLLNKVHGSKLASINILLNKRRHILLDYIDILLNTDINYNTLDNVILLLENLVHTYNLQSCPEKHNNLYRSSIALLRDGYNISKNIFCVYLLNIMCYQNTSEMEVDIQDLIKIFNNVNKLNSKEGNGKLRNLFNSKACEVIYSLLQRDDRDSSYCIFDYIENSLESGDCLRFILQIANIILPKILETDKFNITNFFQCVWNELEAKKTHREYSECMEGFIQLITKEAVLKVPKYNNEVIFYCSKIIEFSMVKIMPLFHLVDAMGRDNVLHYGHLVYVFSEILLVVAVPRKDNRITENLIVDISKESKFTNNKKSVYTTFHTEYRSLEILATIKDVKILEATASLITKKIDDQFKNKQRYHRNSTLHRMLHVALQHLLFIFLKHRNSYVEDVFEWCFSFLIRIPHQTSTKLYLEWYITLYFYFKGFLITDVLNLLTTNKVPILSQFMILYWLLKRRALRNSLEETEFKIVLDYFLENTMGPTYSVRLYAQYLVTRLHLLVEKSKTFNLIGYEQAINVVKKTLTEASKLKEKSYEKLLNDYFVHDFDIVNDLTPCSIYYSSHDERTNEHIDENVALQTFVGMQQLDDGDEDSLYQEWSQFNKNRKISLRKFITVLKEAKEVELTSGIIQKKYIPWKSMSDIDIVDMKKMENKTELIVVASLIDKLPNLGGMARTSEVFAVNTYVIDSLRHLQDKQFQGLSVSAERWVNVVEVRPGQPLKDYLSQKKTEGYAIVAAEQTSNSISLQGFKFPKKTLLLLGNEKEGIPCDLLPYMDVCVEVPQRGVLRSLNVHVTAAIFIWEYSRQHS
ncbi:unnamed protein product [Leptosia nina]|uniref:tRNA (guanosine(18)-2'-O)-methyltransferase TARBP1 n=1 Tax=Leptosia nina TaxID=320188 RepID=A0AAV1IUB2_9NEOP